MTSAHVRMLVLAAMGDGRCRTSAEVAKRVRLPHERVRHALKYLLSDRCVVSMQSPPKNPKNYYAHRIGKAALWRIDPCAPDRVRSKSWFVV